MTEPTRPSHTPPPRPHGGCAFFTGTSIGASVFAWSAWRRLLAVLPALLLLWLGVAWAMPGLFT